MLIKIDTSVKPQNPVRHQVRKKADQCQCWSIISHILLISIIINKMLSGKIVKNIQLNKQNHTSIRWHLKV